VDPSTGAYIREDDDLVVIAPMPIVLRRTYLSRDRKSRHFGIGATHPGEWYLWGDGDPRIPWGELILAGSCAGTRTIPWIYWSEFKSLAG
jgi:hypothetical protein